MSRWARLSQISRVMRFLPNSLVRNQALNRLVVVADIVRPSISRPQARRAQPTSYTSTYADLSSVNLTSAPPAAGPSSHPTIEAAPVRATSFTGKRVQLTRRKKVHGYVISAADKVGLGGALTVSDLDGGGGVLTVANSAITSAEGRGGAGRVERVDARDSLSTNHQLNSGR